jgi:hypothetical protein
MLRVIGKVLRGTNARRLLHYLYGPGRANEHTDPHLVAGFSDPAELEPGRRPADRRICAAWPGCWPSRWPYSSVGLLLSQPCLRGVACRLG